VRGGWPTWPSATWPPPPFPARVRAPRPATVTFSPEYDALLKRVGVVGALVQLVVVVTVFLMATRSGA
jgi:hypothetical protein